MHKKLFGKQIRGNAMGFLLPCLLYAVRCSKATDRSFNFQIPGVQKSPHFLPFVKVILGIWNLIQRQID